MVKEQGKTKAFRYRRNIGKARHVVSFHDGEKTHKDGSPFFEMAIFGRKRDAENLMKNLRGAGYAEQ